MLIVKYVFASQILQESIDGYIANVFIIAYTPAIAISYIIAICAIMRLINKGGVFMVLYISFSQPISFTYFSFVCTNWFG